MLVEIPVLDFVEKKSQSSPMPLEREELRSARRQCHGSASLSVALALERLTHVEDCTAPVGVGPRKLEQR